MSINYEELWDQRAKFFDVDYYNYDMDCEFFKEFMSPEDKVCELGAGTLRLAEQLHESYYKYYGVDISREMLNEGLRNIKLPNITTIHSSMHDVAFPCKMNLIFNMGNSFFMINNEMKDQTLRNAAENLVQDGMFILEVYNYSRWLRRPMNQLIHMRTIPTESDYVSIYYTQSVDVEESKNSMIWFRESVSRKDGQVTKSVYPIEFLYSTPDECEILLGKYFDIIEKYGNFDKSKYHKEESPRLIYVCKAR